MRYEAWKTVNGWWWVVDLKNRRKAKVIQDRLTPLEAINKADQLNGVVRGRVSG